VAVVVEHITHPLELLQPEVVLVVIELQTAPQAQLILVVVAVVVAALYLEQLLTQEVQAAQALSLSKYLTT
jgi:hypothetical protein